jgi:hypothetical protein
LKITSEVFRFFDAGSHNEDRSVRTTNDRCDQIGPRCLRNGQRALDAEDLVQLSVGQQFEERT